MSARHIAFYDPKTGQVSDRSSFLLEDDPAARAAVTPPGFVAIDIPPGVPMVNSRTYRVDLVTGQLVAIPPPPGPAVQSGRGRHVTFYDAKTGVLDSKSVCASDPVAIALNTPPGFVAIDHPPEGILSARTHRVDVATGKAVRLASPLPEPEDPAAKRRALSLQIAALEATQHRPMRELALDQGNAEARKRLDEIDNAIAALRAQLA